jgi:hypothetical protein
MPNRCRRASLRRKPMPLHRWPPHKLMPNAGPALLVARLRVLLPRLPLQLPVGPPTPLAPVRHPIQSLAKHTHRGRGNGTRLPARVNAAICASNTPIHFAVTVSKSRAHLQRSEVHYQLGSRDPAPCPVGGVLVFHGAWRLARRGVTLCRRS